LYCTELYCTLRSIRKVDKADAPLRHSSCYGSLASSRRILQSAYGRLRVMSRSAAFLPRFGGYYAESEIIWERSVFPLRLDGIPPSLRAGGRGRGCTGYTRNVSAVGQLELCEIHSDLPSNPLRMPSTPLLNLKHVSCLLATAPQFLSSQPYAETTHPSKCLLCTVVLNLCWFVIEVGAGIASTQGLASFCFFIIALSIAQPTH
jgi:hypothetical protein